MLLHAALDIKRTSNQRHDVASTLVRHYFKVVCLLGHLKNLFG